MTLLLAMIYSHYSIYNFGTFKDTSESNFPTLVKFCLRPNLSAWIKQKILRIADRGLKLNVNHNFSWNFDQFGNQFWFLASLVFPNNWSILWPKLVLIPFLVHFRSNFNALVSILAVGRPCILQIQKVGRMHHDMSKFAVVHSANLRAFCNAQFGLIQLLAVLIPVSLSPIKRF